MAKVFGKVSSRLRKNLTLDAANKVYKSTILPILDYCDVAWNSIAALVRMNVRNSSRLQKRAANIVPLSSAADMEDLKWLSLISRHTACIQTA